MSPVSGHRDTSDPVYVKLSHANFLVCKDFVNFSTCVKPEGLPTERPSSTWRETIAFTLLLVNPAPSPPGQRPGTTAWERRYLKPPGWLQIQLSLGNPKSHPSDRVLFRSDCTHRSEGGRNIIAQRTPIALRCPSQCHPDGRPRDCRAFRRHFPDLAISVPSVGHLLLYPGPPFRQNLSSPLCRLVLVLDPSKTLRPFQLGNSPSLASSFSGPADDAMSQKRTNSS